MPYKNKEDRKKNDEKNKEKIQENRKKWYEDNKEKVKEYNKIYSEENKETNQENRKKWYEDNKEKVKEYNKTEQRKKTSRISNWKTSGIINDDFDALYELYITTTNCADCDVELVEGRKGNFRCLDHSHETGLFRAVVCNGCNVRRGK